MSVIYLTAGFSCLAEEAGSARIGYASTTDRQAALARLEQLLLEPDVYEAEMRVVKMSVGAVA